ncbi:hypothetical protein GGX14DRAFT_541787 [Mycena pura]|uniref:Uncharacterized protein n=1 Tax=Mycena pura TaxID=153505 RepID=A0AAD6VQJ7_9AGAR|nr:hypothetical protein GGX14DRAFT_541787 [Mycena pura]
MIAVLTGSLVGGVNARPVQSEADVIPVGWHRPPRSLRVFQRQLLVSDAQMRRRVWSTSPDTALNRMESLTFYFRRSVDIIVLVQTARRPRTPHPVRGFAVLAVRFIIMVIRACTYEGPRGAVHPNGSLVDLDEQEPWPGIQGPRSATIQHSKFNIHSISSHGQEHRGPVVQTFNIQSSSFNILSILSLCLDFLGHGAALALALRFDNDDVAATSRVGPAHGLLSPSLSASASASRAGWRDHARAVTCIATATAWHDMCRIEGPPSASAAAGVRDKTQWMDGWMENGSGFGIAADEAAAAFNIFAESERFYGGRVIRGVRLVRAYALLPDANAVSVDGVMTGVLAAAFWLHAHRENDEYTIQPTLINRFPTLVSRVGRRNTVVAPSRGVLFITWGPFQWLAITKRGLGDHPVPGATSANADGGSTWHVQTSIEKKKGEKRYVRRRVSSAGGEEPRRDYVRNTYTMPTKSPSSPPHAVALVSGLWALDGARDTAARLGMRWPGARRRGRDAVWAVAAGQRRRCRAQGPAFKTVVMLASYPAQPPMYKPFFSRLRLDDRPRPRPRPRNLEPPPARPRNPEPPSPLYAHTVRPSSSRGPAHAPRGSIYSLSSTSSPTLDSASTPSGSRARPPVPALTVAVGPTWPSRAPTSSTTASAHDPSPRASSELSSLSSSPSPSPPDTPVESAHDLANDLSEAERRRRQLAKATRILGESVPLELVFQPRHPLVRAFPAPPPRREESPLPGQLPREALTERAAGAAAGARARAGTTASRKGIARRASLSLSSFASKFRPGTAGSAGAGAASARSSQDAEAPSDHGHGQAHYPHSPGLSDHGHGHGRAPPSPAPSSTLSRRHSVALASPVIFAFPGRALSPSPSPPRSRARTPDTDVKLGLVIDISSGARALRYGAPSPAASPASCGPYGDYDSDSDAEATPVVEHPAARLRAHTVSLPDPRAAPPAAAATHTHTHTGSEPAVPAARPETPFADYARPETPFSHYAHTRPQTPFSHYAHTRPQTPFADHADYAEHAFPDALRDAAPRPQTPFADLDAAPVPAADAVVARRERRAGLGWSGEWNQRDMQDVIQKLRTLR